MCRKQGRYMAGHLYLRNNEHMPLRSIGEYFCNGSLAVHERTLHLRQVATVKLFCGSIGQFRM